MLLMMSIKYSTPISVIARGVNRREECIDDSLSKLNDD